MQRLLAIGCVVMAALWTFFISGLAIPFMLLNEPIAHKFVRCFGWGWCLIFGVRVKMEGLENLRDRLPLVLTPNHSSAFDIFVASILPVDFKWILKREIMWIPVLGWGIAAMGNYRVRRDGSGRDLQMMKKVEAGLRRGKSVLIFPEGTRSRTGELLPLKKGAFRVAENSESPICPVAFIGTYEICPTGQLPRRRGHLVTVRVGRPFTVAEAGGIGPARERLRRELMELYGKGK